ncbi:MAG: ATP-binding protein [Planctomycetes bacterium]|nr:ATP-binding protein [Planctomycetota bacterium]
MHDWSALITRGFESKELDYKAPMKWDAGDKAACCALVKDILALSNTNGGCIVIGVSELQNGKFILEGLTEEQTTSFETTRINQFLQNYSDPPINCTVVQVDHDNKAFIILQVPAFPDTPHICQKDFPKVLSATALYVRTDNNESAPLKSSADFRLVVENAVRNRADKLLSSFRAILKEGAPKESDEDIQRFEAEIVDSAKACDRQEWSQSRNLVPYRETVFFPDTYNASLFPIDALRETANKINVEYRGWPFVHVSRNDSETYFADKCIETALGGKKSLHFWRLWQSGLLYTQENLRFLSGDRDPDFLDFDSFCLLACDAVQTLVRLYSDHLQPDAAVTMRFSLFSVKDLPFSSSNPNRIISRHPERWSFCRVNAIRYEATHRIAEWRSGMDTHAVELCKHVFRLFNVGDSTWLPEAKKLMVRMLERRL